MADTIKRYKKDDVTVVWEAEKCSHSKKCFHDLPEVFNPKSRPWVQMDGADCAEIIKQVKACPSGALSIEGEECAESNEECVESNTATEISVAKGGPLFIKGDLDITLADGEQVKKQGMTALCRCGASKNKPYCDGSHNKIEFDC